MKKALFINENKDVEVVTYSKISEYLEDYSKGQICDSLKVYYTSETMDSLVINDESYGLPLMVIPNVKMNNYDLEALCQLFDTSNDQIEISDDDFWAEDDDYEDEQDSKDEEDEW